MQKKHKGLWVQMVTAAMLLCSGVVATQAAAAGRAYLRADGHWIQDYYDPVNRPFLDLVTHAHIVKMEIRYKEGRYQRAMDDLRYTVAHVPNHPYALKKGVEVCQVKPHFLKCKEVTKWFEDAIDWTPKEPNAYALYGLHLHNLGQLDEAMKKYKMAISLRPSLTDAHYNLALIYLEREEYQEATKHAETAYQLGHRSNGLRNSLVAKGFMSASGN